MFISVQNKQSSYETTLPIALTIILSVILLILIIVRVVQCCQERRAKRHLKDRNKLHHYLLVYRGVGGCELGRDTSTPLWWPQPRRLRACRAKAKDHSLEEGEEKEKQSKTSAPKKRGKLIKLSKHKEATDGADAAPIVPAHENGSFLQSGIRTHPTRRAENKSWYDSKVIPYIDDGGASLDNLYLPDKAIQEVV
ncbi:hypothetical protein EGR_07513 [Echinococcus granulosus]|uniref:Uncharacterized protein n=1 Tax=Echinococcus granulosus TaxID=6210 RepID=W6UHR9_ECHGR|nr:hypothetical protein EGR_07513 [Echinococcus granulosus]EUB57637.1 hypothetical protein EGR_07513 [Echinococcus granulosus]